MATCMIKLPNTFEQFLVGMSNGTLQKIKKYQHSNGIYGPRTFYTNRGKEKNSVK